MTWMTLRSTRWWRRSAKCMLGGLSCARSTDRRRLVVRGKPRIVASVEARMASSRLPGKVLSDIAGKPALLRLLDRLQRAKTLDAVVVATTDQSSDDVLARTVEAAGISCYRGSENDVLNRVVEAHRMMKSEIV